MSSKGIIGIVLAVIGLFILSRFIGFSMIEPGNVGIVVNMYGTNKGVNDIPVKTGAFFYNNFTSNVYKFPTTLQTMTWTKDESEGSPNNDSITFNSIEGAACNVDISIAYSFMSEKIPSIFMEFRKSAKEITDTYIRSQVRDTFSRVSSKMKVTDIFGSGKQKLLEDVKKDLNDRMIPKGITFDMISIVGAIRVDTLVSESINAVITATQKAVEAENKIRESQAQAQQAIATSEGSAQAILTVAKAQAEANRLLAASITQTIVNYEAVKKWDGVSPQVVSGSGSNMIFPLTNNAK